MWDHIVSVPKKNDNVVVVSHKLFKITCHHYRSVSVPLADEDRGKLTALLNRFAVPFILSVVG